MHNLASNMIAQRIASTQEQLQGAERALENRKLEVESLRQVLKELYESLDLLEGRNRDG